MYFLVHLLIELSSPKDVGSVSLNLLHDYQPGAILLGLRKVAEECLMTSANGAAHTGCSWTRRICRRTGASHRGSGETAGIELGMAEIGHIANGGRYAYLLLMDNAR